MVDLAAGWTVCLIDAVVDEFLELPAGLQGKMFALLELVETVGPFQIPPKRKKHLRGEIWELRVDAFEGTARALYITKVRSVFILKIFVKKTGKTPQAVVALAESRIREV